MCIFVHTRNWARGGSPERLAFRRRPAKRSPRTHAPGGGGGVLRLRNVRHKSGEKYVHPNRETINIFGSAAPRSLCTRFMLEPKAEMPVVAIGTTTKCARIISKTPRRVQGDNGRKARGNHSNRRPADRRRKNTSNRGFLELLIYQTFFFVRSECYKRIVLAKPFFSYKMCLQTF